MSTPFFQDKVIIAHNTDTWPDSPDRVTCNAGKKAWAAVVSGTGFKEEYGHAINLTSCKEIIASCLPAPLDKCMAFRKDPVLALTQQALKAQAYIVDDNFTVAAWNKDAVKHHARIKKISDKPAIYEQGPSLIDFGQMYLGDCGFVSTIGAISIHPEGHDILFSGIYPPVYNPAGIYSVRVIHDGEILYVVVDDDLPQESYSNMVDHNEFWYFIYEKAFAKISGGYHNLGGGFEKYLGLEPTENISITTDNKQEIWKKHFIPIFQKNGRTTYRGTGNPEETKYLVANHAYAVIDAAEWENIRLVRLHNPWNVANYDKEYSPNSEFWRFIPEHAQKTIFQRSRFWGNADGKEQPKTFWMPYDYYCHDLPSISELILSAKLPEVLKSIIHASLPRR